MKERIRIESNVGSDEIPAWTEPAVERYVAKPVSGIVEREKNEDERRMIRVTNEVLKEFVGSLGLADVEVRNERIHIVEPDEYKKYRLGGRGSTHFEEIYIQRSEQRTRFLRDLTHEIIHSASSQVILVEHEKTVREGKDNHQLKVGSRQSGLAFSPKGSKEPGYKRFEGVNEAVIEMIAFTLRERMMERTESGFSEEEKVEMRHYAYPHPLLLREIITKVSKDSQEQERWFRDLSKDVFEGTYTSIKRLGSTWRQQYGENIVPLLSQMDDSLESAAHVARTLGFATLADHIRSALKGKAEPSEPK